MQQFIQFISQIITIEYFEYWNIFFKSIAIIVFILSFFIVSSIIILVTFGNEIGYEDAEEVRVRSNLSWGRIQNSTS